MSQIEGGAQEAWANNGIDYTRYNAPDFFGLIWNREAVSPLGEGGNGLLNRSGIFLFLTGVLTGIGAKSNENDVIFWNKKRHIL